ncbi:MAG: TlpA family protein disulfide reductase [Alphaproteobacteria bacterium]|nr:TlpA family protein disulfide reductase [Alphaproteobacteria bacterium]
MQGWFSKYIIWIGIIFLLIMLSFFNWIKNDRLLKIYEAEVASHFKSFEKPKESFSVSDIEILGPTGSKIKLSHYYGRYLIINLWATWCTPCIEELPSLNKLRLQLKAAGKRWSVMAVSVDAENNMDKMTAMVDRLDVEDLAAYYDHKNTLQNTLKTNVLPTTFIVSDSGKVLYTIKGDAIWHDPAVLELLERIEHVY